MKTKPLPEWGQDPSNIKAQELRAGFDGQVRNIRSNRSLTNLQVAEQVVALWESSNAELVRLYQDLQERRRARLEELETVVPLGPAIPEDASAADVAVLQQAFRTALAEARNAMPAQAVDPNIPSISGPGATTLDGMLADAEKFDDDNLRRAVLTAALEGGHRQVVRAWTDHMGVTHLLDEYDRLRLAIAGQGIEGSANYFTFKPISAPLEVADLPRLQAEQERQVEQRARDADAERRWRGSTRAAF